MVTAIDIITDALEEIGYKAAETPLEADDIRVGLKRLNGMLSEWELAGKGLGVAPVKNPADVLRLPQGLESPVMYNLAGRLTAPMRVPMTSELANNISAASKNLLTYTAKLGKINFPDTIPLGSGNNCDYGDFNDVFFPENEQGNF